MTNRREFLKRAAVAATATAAMTGDISQAVSTQKPLKKAVQLGMLPKELSDRDKFKLVKSCGFEGVEAYPMDNLDAARKQAEAASQEGIRIHSLCYGGWKAPLSSPDPKVVKKGLKAVENALHCAHVMKADTILLVPAVVTADVRYVEAYERSQENIRKLIPLAEELKVVIAVEEVWNKFLLSPLEFARYIDEFESPWVRAYFDVANVVDFGWPQDWIRTLGSRIVKVHLKEFRKKDRAWPPLGEGDVNWPEVHKALIEEVGYRGYGTTELPGGNADYLKDLSNRIDRLINY